MWLTDLAPKLRLAVPVLLASAALAACATGEKPVAKESLTPVSQYSIKVEETPDRLALAPHAEGLSPTQRAALIGFFGRWREASEAGDLVIQTPRGADPAATSRMVSELSSGLQTLGAPAQRVRIGDYDAGTANPAAPVLVTFTQLEAHGSECSHNWSQFTSTGENRPTEHFGCVVTANIAAQVANPRDFLGPAASTPSDAARRDTVLGKYRRGEITSTPRDEQAQGAVSGAIK